MTDDVQLLLETLAPFVAFSRAMTECYNRNAPACRAQKQGRDCFWQQGFMPYSEYAAKRMCDCCAAAWYARCLGLELEDHLRHLGHRPLDVEAAIADAITRQAHLLSLEQLAHEVGDLVEALRTALQPRCVRVPGNCRRTQAGQVGRTTLLAAEANPVMMCKPCALVWLADMTGISAQRVKADGPPFEPGEGTERAP